ncbi:MAG: hypothetical protein H6736_24010 [Alphaproteobacteria bacterium]|nr:hypothetical protein [Alphaproteobacteria bacterium]MCB9694886.1 hypothetical protein [Alphaproteobacteria bacterium]
MQQQRRRSGSAPDAGSSGGSQQPVDRNGAGGYHYRLHADGRVEIVRASGSIFVTRESNPRAYDAIIAEVGAYPGASAAEQGPSSDTPFLDGVEAEAAPEPEVVPASRAEAPAAAAPAEQAPVSRTGSGGYTYQLYADGRIDIVKGSRTTTITAESNARAYAAIVAEVGSYPAASVEAPAVEAPASATPVQEPTAPPPVEEVVAQAEPELEAQAPEQAPAEAEATDDRSLLDRITGALGGLFGRQQQPASEVEAAEEEAKAGPDASGDIDVNSMDRDELAIILADPQTYGFSVWAAAHARDRMLEHQEAVDATGVGTIEGVHTEDKTPGAEREDCTTFVLETLEAAFGSAGQAGLFAQVKAQAVRASGSGGFKGIELMKALQNHAGWKSIFWAPDTKQSADEDAEHTFASSVAERKGTYYGVDVDREKSVTDYRKTDGSEGDMSGIERLKRIPVGVLGARGGMHMALIINGSVYEVHWKEAATSRDAVEATTLENWPWLSGMVTAPAADVDRAFA